jgi:membrane protease YdiL (CAAX protease family)
MRKLLEPLLMFALIMLYIWKLRAAHPYGWVVIPPLLILSHVLHHENARELGFTLHGLPGLLMKIAPALLLIAVALLSAGALFHTLRPTSFRGVVFALAPYLPWGLTQQYLLNGYFLNRFDAGLSARSSNLLAILLFGVVHAPNLFLMAVTLPLAACAVVIYRRTRNLYLLGFGHAIIGLLLFLAIPDSISHHLRIGPGYFRPY